MKTDDRCSASLFPPFNANAVDMHHLTAKPT